MNSLLQQDHTHLEVLVIDDGSNDESPLLVRRIGEGDARIILVKKPHVGIAGTRNAGLSWVSETSRYVLFLDQDDILQPTVLSPSRQHIESPVRRRWRVCHS
ncbi:glycosyltransferase family A protein [Ornithinimicrobium flavum]|uniref:glycosyltransferase family A protein n=1 Tax=Ornithinimicrobium flavum TaxID=1288636 RepID=UPI003B830A58